MFVKKGHHSVALPVGMTAKKSSKGQGRTISAVFSRVSHVQMTLCMASTVAIGFFYRLSAFIVFIECAF